jgi:hypothetical protein
MNLEVPSSWSGQHIGKVSKQENIVSKKGSLYTLKTGDTSWDCEVHIDRFSLLALADECANLFGFFKVGTTTITLGNTRYTCARILAPVPVPITVTSSSLFIVRQKLQDFLVFRWIFGAITNPKTNLFGYRGRYMAGLVTVRLENKGFPEEDWFVDTPKDSKIRLLAGRKTESVMQEIRVRMKQINSSAIIYIQELYSRLSPLHTV